ncbi:hypothetical protein AOQ84DRAFT_107793 [Glonium stellatum]|uniref:Uncharacterized protein n=1 Tax=Glonium stellatum TaxID=574774 RepID=A0A8E2EUI7_9PEZI|nr:hypothetical protein AOQ84DRAFT_107793 [Glonium stellatum]
MSLARLALLTPIQLIRPTPIRPFHTHLEAKRLQSLNTNRPDAPASNLCHLETPTSRVSLFPTARTPLNKTRVAQLYPSSPSFTLNLPCSFHSFQRTSDLWREFCAPPLRCHQALLKWRWSTQHLKHRCLALLGWASLLHQLARMQIIRRAG